MPVTKRTNGDTDAVLEGRRCAALVRLTPNRSLGCTRPPHSPEEGPHTGNIKLNGRGGQLSTGNRPRVPKEGLCEVTVTWTLA